MERALEGLEAGVAMRGSSPGGLNGLVMSVPVPGKQPPDVSPCPSPSAAAPDVFAFGRGGVTRQGIAETPVPRQEEPQQEPVELYRLTHMGDGTTGTESAGD